MVGYVLICMGIVTWMYAFYSICLSKWFMPRTGHKVLDWVKEDMYYCCAVPCYLMIMCIVVYFNWSAMKYFRHAQ